MRGVGIFHSWIRRMLFIVPCFSMTIFVGSPMPQHKQKSKMVVHSELFVVILTDSYNPGCRYTTRRAISSSCCIGPMCVPVTRMVAFPRAKYMERMGTRLEQSFPVRILLVCASTNSCSNLHTVYE